MRLTFKLNSALATLMHHGLNYVTYKNRIFQKGVRRKEGTGAGMC